MACLRRCTAWRWRRGTVRDSAQPMGCFELSPECFSNATLLTIALPTTGCRRGGAAAARRAGPAAVLPRVGGTLPRAPPGRGAASRRQLALGCAGAGAGGGAAPGGSQGAQGGGAGLESAPCYARITIALALGCLPACLPACWPHLWADTANTHVRRHVLPPPVGSPG